MSYHYHLTLRDKLGGGKFSNGAVSGAFVHMFNAEGLTMKQSFSKLWTKITDGTIANDIGTGFKGGLNGYRDVRDNAPMVPRYMLKVSMTAVELGLTGWIKDPALYIYVNVNTAVMLDTIPYTNPVSAGTSLIYSYTGHDNRWFK